MHLPKRLDQKHIIKRLDQKNIIKFEIVDMIETDTHILSQNIDAQAIILSNITAISPFIHVFGQGYKLSINLTTINLPSQNYVL